MPLPNTVVNDETPREGVLAVANALYDALEYVGNITPTVYDKAISFIMDKLKSNKEDEVEFD